LRSWREALRAAPWLSPPAGTSRRQRGARTSCCCSRNRQRRRASLARAPRVSDRPGGAELLAGARVERAPARFWCGAAARLVHRRDGRAHLVGHGRHVAARLGRTAYLAGCRLLSWAGTRGCTVMFLGEPPRIRDPQAGCLALCQDVRLCRKARAREVWKVTRWFTRAGVRCRRLAGL